MSIFEYARVLNVRNTNRSTKIFSGVQDDFRLNIPNFKAREKSNFKKN